MALSLPNPGFEINTDSWSPSGTTTFERVTDQHHSGVGSGHAIFDGATAYGVVAINADGEPAGGAHQLGVGAWLRGTGQVSLVARVFIDGFSNARYGNSGTITLSSTWAYYEAVATTQAGDTIDDLVLIVGAPDWLSGATTSAEVWIDDARVFEVVTGNPGLRRIRNQFQLRPY